MVAQMCRIAGRLLLELWAVGNELNAYTFP